MNRFHDIDGVKVNFTAEEEAREDAVLAQSIIDKASYEALEWSRSRAEAYPSLTDQADMAYWDRQNGTTTLDDAITAVKEAHPKPA
jgi:hypothetical protein